MTCLPSLKDIDAPGSNMVTGQSIIPLLERIAGFRLPAKSRDVTTWMGFIEYAFVAQRLSLATDRRHPCGLLAAGVLG